MRSSALAIGIVVACAVAHADPNQPFGIDPVALEKTRSLARAAAKKVFTTPKNRPTGRPLALAVKPRAEGDTRAITVTLDWIHDDGRRTQEVYELEERIDKMRAGREYAAALHVSRSRKIETDGSQVSETEPLHGRYMRLAEPMSSGSSDFCVTVSSTTYMDEEGYVPDPNTLDRIKRYEDDVDHAMQALAGLPLRVGETKDVVPSVFVTGLWIGAVHREPDRAGAARYIFDGSDYTTRATLVVDPVRGRALSFRMDSSERGTSHEIVFRYRD